MSRLAASVLALCLLLAAPAQALDLDPPMELPGAGANVASADGWLLGVARGAPVPPGARRIGPTTFVVPRARARAAAAALRRQGALLFAEPDRRTTRRRSAPDTALDGWARGAVVPSSLAPPPSPGGIAVIDDFVDPTHPDLTANTGFLNATPTSTLDGPHGTEVASAAAGILQGTGVAGVLPGAPIASYGVTFPASCSAITEGVYAAIRARVAVINLSLGSPSFCYAQYLAVQRAFGVGILVVAAAGNEFQAGNPVNFPAALPHVVSVAALDRSLAPAAFSTANAGVDVAAPGVEVPMAIPPSFDTQDGFADGYTLADGTSFAAPMVAGGAAWIRAARPELSVGQVADALRFSARDVHDQGYDDDTGWGLMDIPAALNEPEPRDDPIEPNDGIDFVDGRVFAKPDKVRWNGTGRTSLKASSDQWEDPLDVYRFRLAARSRARITVDADFGNADLAVFDQVAKSTSKRRGRVCVSTRPEGQQDRCVVVWNGRGARFGYVAVAAGGARSLNTVYTLRFSRQR